MFSSAQLDLCTPNGCLPFPHLLMGFIQKSGTVDFFLIGVCVWIIFPYIFIYFMSHIKVSFKVLLIHIMVIHRANTVPFRAKHWHFFFKIIKGQNA